MASNGDGTALEPRSESPPGSPRSASVSLQAAATMNAGLQHEPSRRMYPSSLDARKSRAVTDVALQVLLAAPSRAIDPPREMAAVVPPSS